MFDFQLDLLNTSFKILCNFVTGTSFLVRVRGKTGCYFSNALVYVLLKYAGNRSFLDLMSEVSVTSVCHK